LLSIEDTRERLGDRCRGEPDAVGDAVQPVDGQHRYRYHHVLGEPAVVVVPHRHLVAADGLPSAPALIAPSTRDRGDHLYPVPGGPAGRAVPDVDPLPGDLVPHDAWRHDVVVAELEDLYVGTARGTVAYPDLHLAGTRRRFGYVLDADVSGGVEPH